MTPELAPFIPRHGECFAALLSGVEPDSRQRRLRDRVITSRFFDHISLPLRRNSRPFSDGSCNIETLSSVEDDTGEGTLLSKFPQYANVRNLLLQDPPEMSSRMTTLVA
ncbi:hypothetical protein TNCV_4260521 [Trichonephila clavipes]|nr:hypothetical protein TNCV_4260521 [Trichonephila clavipes]